MDVTREDVLRCADLTRLSLGEDEIEPLRRDLAQLLSHAESLASLPLDGIEPWTQAMAGLAPPREDVARDGFTQAEALANAPQVDRGHFVGPKVL